MQDLSSLTREKTRASCSGTTGTPGKSQQPSYTNIKMKKKVPERPNYTNWNVYKICARFSEEDLGKVRVILQKISEETYVQKLRKYLQIWSNSTKYY